MRVPVLGLALADGVDYAVILEKYDKIGNLPARDRWISDGCFAGSGLAELCGDSRLGHPALRFALMFKSGRIVSTLHLQCFGTGKAGQSAGHRNEEKSAKFRHESVSSQFPSDYSTGRRV